MWDARCSRPVAELPRAHATRVKGVAALGASVAAGVEADAGGGEAAPLAASAASDGSMRVWDLRAAAGNRCRSAHSFAMVQARWALLESRCSGGLLAWHPCI